MKIGVGAHVMVTEKTMLKSCSSFDSTSTLEFVLTIREPRPGIILGMTSVNSDKSWDEFRVLADGVVGWCWWNCVTSLEVT